MKPHPELIERQLKPGPVPDRRNLEQPVLPGLYEQKVPRHDRKQNNAVIQVVDMGLADEQIQVGYTMAHDQEHEDPGASECYEECDEDDSGEACRKWRAG